VPDSTQGSSASWEDDIHSGAETLTAAASGAVRQIAFAGIAAVWILRNPTPTSLGLSRWLLGALLCFVLTLALDLAQLLFGARYFTKRSAALVGIDVWGLVSGGIAPGTTSNPSNPDSKAHHAYIRTVATLFWMKAAVLCVAFVLLAAAFVAAVIG
jgi:hypothetical protein